MHEWIKKYKVEWCYNERHHDKGPIDGIRGTIKNKVFHDVNSGKVHIEDAKSSAEYAGLTIDNIKSLYLLVNVVLEKPDDNDPAPKIT